jgi:hypothetical protein
MKQGVQIAALEPVAWDGAHPVSITPIDFGLKGVPRSLR